MDHLQGIRRFFCVALFAAMPIFAQTGLGVVTGTVQDSTGAAVPSAQLKLTEAGTNVMREATSNSAGIHYFGSVALVTMC